MSASSSALGEVDAGAPRAPAARRALPPWWSGAIAGLVAAAIAIACGELVAALSDVVHPLDAVGSGAIDRTPVWLRELAIDWFGTNDKRALKVGMVLVITAIAAALGARGLRRPEIGATGIVAFGILGSAAVAERPNSPWNAVVVPLIAAAVGAGTLCALIAMITDRWLFARTPRRSLAPLGWDRRRFLVASGAVTAAAVVAGTGAARVEQRRQDDLAQAAPDVLPPIVEPPVITEAAPSDELAEGITPFITPNGDFYRIDTALSLPRADLGSWTVRVYGLVEREVTLTYDDLLAMPQVERMVTLCCVSNEIGGDLIGNAVWQGVLLRDVLDRAGVRPEAEQVFSRSIDGFTCGFPTSVALDGRDCMIAIGMNGEALPLAHGFPARLVVPGLYGYVSATKWLAEIELTTWAAREGYWVPRGWSREAPIKTQSRIDVPRAGSDVRAGPVAVAGVAWAQHRGVDRVEVRIDDGDWQQATLGDDVTDDAWRQWVYRWDAMAGEHRVQVRATDKNGETQTEEVSSPDPDGATGYHTRRVSVVG